MDLLDPNALTTGERSSCCALKESVGWERVLINDSITKLPAPVDNVVTSTGFSLILFYLRFILLFASPFSANLSTYTSSADITYRRRIQMLGCTKASVCSQRRVKKHVNCKKHAPLFFESLRFMH